MVCTCPQDPDDRSSATERFPCRARARRQASNPTLCITRLRSPTRPGTSAKAKTRAPGRSPCTPTEMLRAIPQHYRALWGQRRGRPKYLRKGRARGPRPALEGMGGPFAIPDETVAKVIGDVARRKGTAPGPGGPPCEYFWVAALTERNADMGCMGMPVARQISRLALSSRAPLNAVWLSYGHWALPQHFRTPMAFVGGPASHWSFCPCASSLSVFARRVFLCSNAADPLGRRVGHRSVRHGLGRHEAHPRTTPCPQVV